MEEEIIAKTKGLSKKEKKLPNAAAALTNPAHQQQDSSVTELTKDKEKSKAKSVVPKSTKLKKTEGRHGKRSVIVEAEDSEPGRDGKERYSLQIPSHSNRTSAADIRSHGGHGHGQAGRVKSSNSEGRRKSGHTTSASVVLHSEGVQTFLNDPDAESSATDAIEEFLNIAWEICAQRFNYEAAKTICVMDLRDAWLRIIEMEWLEGDMLKSQKDNLLSKTVIPDERPLPIAYDRWSRGVLEEFPREKRESILDPFLRDIPELYASHETPELYETHETPELYASHETRETLHRGEHGDVEDGDEDAQSEIYPDLDYKDLEYKEEVVV